jgi:hypothetical protein
MCVKQVYNMSEIKRKRKKNRDRENSHIKNIEINVYFSV